MEVSWKALLMAAEMTVDCHLAERMRSCASARRDVPPPLSAGVSRSLAAQGGFVVFFVGS